MWKRVLVAVVLALFAVPRERISRLVLPLTIQYVLTVPYCFVWSSQLLMFALPHHLEVLSNSVASGSIGHRTIRGFVVPVVADTWRMTEHLPTATWGPR